MLEKQAAIRSNAIRNAAKGAPCTVQIVGVCTGDTRTSVLAHFPDESHGLSRKSDDVSAGISCLACHRVINGVDPWPESELEYREWYLRRAMIRTWRRLIALGVVEVKP